MNDERTGAGQAPLPSGRNFDESSRLVTESESDRTLWLSKAGQIKKLLVWLSLVTCSSLMAQDSVPMAVTINNRTGDLPFSAQIGSQFEHVELSSGNLIVTIPFLSVPGRGMSFDYGIRYDAAYWVIQNLSGGAPMYWNPEMRNWLTNSTLGWTSTQPYMTRQTGQMTCYTGVSGPQPKAQGARTDGVIFTDEKGSKHQLLVNSQSNGDCIGGAYLFQNLQGPSLSQDGYWGTAAAVTGPDGRIYSGGGTSGGLSWPAAGTLNGAYFADMAKVTDTRGNTQIASPGNLDSVGRTPITEQTTGNQMIYTVHDSNGNAQQYTVNLESISISTHFGGQGITEYSHTRQTVSSVGLPNGQSYSFIYDSYGDITQINLPTGGYVSYVWTNTPGTSQGATRYISSRTVNDGVTSATWTISYGSGVVLLTDPPDPQGNVHTTTYTYSLSDGTPVLSSVVYDKSSNGSYPRGYAMTYYISPSFTFNGQFSIDGQQLLKSITTTMDANSGGTGGTVSKKEYDYDVFAFERYDTDCTTPTEESACESYASGGSMPPPEFDSISRGNVTAIREYGAGTGSPGPLVRQTIRKYLPDYTPGYGMTPNGLDPLKRVKYTGVNIVDKAIDETVYDSAATCTGTGTVDSDTGVFTPPPTCAANRVSERTLQYDNQTPSTYGFHGEATASAQWLNTTNSYYTTTYVHDGFGNLTSASDPKSHTTSLGYGDSFATGVSTCAIQANSSVYPTSITNALNQTEKLTYYGCTGKKSADRDPNDVAAARAGTTWTYDEIGRVLTGTEKDGGSVTNSYGDTYPDTITTQKLITSSQTETNIIQADGLGRQVKTTLSSDPSGATYSTTSYDLLGRVYQTSNPYRSTSDPTYGLATNYYDVLNRPTSVNEPDGSAKRWSYSGFATTYTDEAGNQWQRTSDALGRLTRVLEPNGTSTSPTMETDYSYDLLDNLTNVKQWGGAYGASGSVSRSFNYDSLARLMSASNPETGIQTYLYLSNGSLCSGSVSLPCSKTDARGAVITYVYDQLNRLQQKSYVPTSTPSVSYVYDQGSSSINPISHRTSMTDGAGSESWTYDPMGRILSINRSTTTPVSTQSNSATYTYNLAGLPVIGHFFAQGSYYQYSYGNDGRAIGVTWNGSAPYISGATYAPNGGLATMTMGGPPTNSVQIFVTHHYNNLLQPTDIMAGPTSQTLFSHTLSYASGANNGDISSDTDNINPGNIATFGYDTLNRMKAANSPGGGVVSPWSEANTFDQFGNLTAKTDTYGSNQISFSATAVSNNQLAGVGFSYDPTGAGYVLQDNKNTQYTWDAEGRLASSTGNGGSVTYKYDGDGNRVLKSNPNAADGSKGSVYWYGPDGSMTDETTVALNGTNARDLQRNFYFDGKLIARQGFPTTFYPSYFIVSDHLGSTRATVDLSWNGPGTNPSPELINYFPFGGYLGTTPSDTVDQKFTGKGRDTESGSDYFGARYYTSNLGRFLAPDWASTATPVPYASLDDPQSLNLYGYVRGNPFNRVDVNGHAPLNCSGGNAEGIGCMTIAARDSEFGIGSEVLGQVIQHTLAKRLQQTLTAKTTAGGPKGTIFERQFELSTPSKKGGYIIQYVSAVWTAPDSTKIYWEAFQIEPGATSPKPSWPEGGSDEFSGGLFSKITADAQFYEGLTPDELRSLFRDTGGTQVKQSGAAPSTDKDPHVPIPAASNILHVTWYNVAAP